jgi:hypothetical protein
VDDGQSSGSCRTVVVGGLPSRTPSARPPGWGCSAERVFATPYPLTRSAPQGAGRVQQLRRMQQLRRRDTEAGVSASGSTPPWPAVTPYLHSRGTAACSSPQRVTFFARRGGHTTWTCRTCDETVYGPPLNTHCTALDGSCDCTDLHQTGHDADQPDISRRQRSHC